MYLKKKILRNVKHLWKVEKLSIKCNHAFDIARAVVNRSYPSEDVDTLQHFKKKYGQPCDVVAKDKCFYLVHQEDVDDDGEKTDTSSHFDFDVWQSKW